MDATRIDAIARFLAERRSRRAMARAGAGLAAGLTAAGGVSSATQSLGFGPAAASPDQDGPTLLFLQAFHSGAFSASDAEGRYTLTLPQGLGHTVSFSDRPDRVVGVTPTPRFLAELGFPDDNPPNAALVVETSEGNTEIAVVELFSPAYDEANHSAIYQAAVLGEWERATRHHRRDDGRSRRDPRKLRLRPPLHRQPTRRWDARLQSVDRLLLQQLLLCTVRLARHRIPVLVGGSPDVRAVFLDQPQRRLRRQFPGSLRTGPMLRQHQPPLAVRLTASAQTR